VNTTDTHTKETWEERWDEEFLADGELTVREDTQEDIERHKDFIRSELSRLEEEKDRAIAKARTDTKIDMIGIFHGSIESVYGKEFADNMMKIVNAYADALITKKENSK
jgi:hypothetical protein